MSGRELLLDVRGLPIAQGSARAFVAKTAGGKPRAIVATEGNRQSSPLGAWRTAIANEARDVMSGAPWVGPIAIELVFRFPRPQAHYHRGGTVIRLAAPTAVAKKPDIDKLARAALDALAAVVFRDDAQVARLVATKRYVELAEGPGVRVLVRQMEETR